MKCSKSVHDTAAVDTTLLAVKGAKEKGIGRRQRKMASGRNGIRKNWQARKGQKLGENGKGLIRSKCAFYLICCDTFSFVAAMPRLERDNIDAYTDISS
jgi:hypothetical protein